MAETTKNLATMNDGGFGVVTVINAKCVSIEYLNTAVAGGDIKDWAGFCKKNDPETIANTIYDAYEGAYASGDGCYIDTLKVANLNVEGPSKTITGGQYASPLIKFGKTATCELQDALGHMDALAILGGVEIDSKKQLHVTSKFGKPVAILGDTFVIDRVSGDQVPVMEVIYQFLPNSIISLTQASDGDAAVFDLNGSLIATDVKKGEDTVYYGAFYSIIDPVSGTGGGGDSSEPTPATINYTITVSYSDTETTTTKTGTGAAGDVVTVTEAGYEDGTVTLVAGTTEYTVTLQKSE